MRIFRVGSATRALRWWQSAMCGVTSPRRTSRSSASAKPQTIGKPSSRGATSTWWTIIDIGHWWVGSDYARVVGTMRNFFPERMVRATSQFMRMNTDDGDIFIGEYTNCAIGSIQSSFVTVGVRHGDHDELTLETELHQKAI